MCIYIKLCVYIYIYIYIYIYVYIYICKVILFSFPLTVHIQPITKFYWVYLQNILLLQSFTPPLVPSCTEALLYPVQITTVAFQLVFPIVELLIHSLFSLQ